MKVKWKNVSAIVGSQPVDIMSSSGIAIKMMQVRGKSGYSFFFSGDITTNIQDKEEAKAAGLVLAEALLEIRQTLTAPSIAGIIFSSIRGNKLDSLRGKKEHKNGLRLVKKAIKKYYPNSLFDMLSYFWYLSRYRKQKELVNVTTILTKTGDK